EGPRALARVARLDARRLAHLVPRELRDRLPRVLRREQRQGDGRLAHPVLRLQRLPLPGRAVPGTGARRGPVASLPVPDRFPGRGPYVRVRTRRGAAAARGAMGVRRALPRGRARPLEERPRAVLRVRRLTRAPLRAPPRRPSTGLDAHAPPVPRGL